MRKIYIPVRTETDENGIITPLEVQAYENEWFEIKNPVNQGMKYYSADVGGKAVRYYCIVDFVEPREVHLYNEDKKWFVLMENYINWFAH